MLFVGGIVLSQPCLFNIFKPVCIYVAWTFNCLLGNDTIILIAFWVNLYYAKDSGYSTSITITSVSPLVDNKRDISLGRQPTPTYFVFVIKHHRQTIK